MRDFFLFLIAASAIGHCWQQGNQTDLMKRQAVAMERVARSMKLERIQKERVDARQL